jgi:hypothetical protein
MTLSPDLLICLIVIGFISGGLFIVGLWIGGRRGHASAAVFGALAVLILIAYALWLTDSPWLANALPVADVLLWGNLQLPAAGLLGGIAWSSLKSPLWQRLLLVAVLLGVGVWRESAPLFGRRPALGSARWVNGVCRQTSKSSCSAAAAATLLNIYGIQSSESEMVDLCLTHVDGTCTLGLYRGLKIKTAGTAWTVWIGSPPASGIDRWPLPALVRVALPGLPPDALGKNVGHSIVVLRAFDGKFVIADPYAGRQVWTREQLIDAYGGIVTALAPRLGGKGK